jgi:sirohydrochlorin cobaltochelatase
MTPDAIVVFAHGARDPEWARPIEKLAALIAERAPAARVSCAYLELMRPSLPEAIDALVGEGVRTVRIVPAFIGAGGHLKRDLPTAVDALRAAHPQLQIELAPHIGESDAALAAIADVFTR